MKSVRNHGQFLGIIALSLLCLTFAAAPASAVMGGAEFDGGNDTELSVRSQISDAFSTFQDRIAAFLLDIGSIFANQDGSWILD